MKKTFFVLGFLAISIAVSAQQQGSYTPDSIVLSVADELGPLPKIIPCKYNDMELRGKFYMVFKNEKNWKEFSIAKNGSYRWINARETEWYDKTMGPENSSRRTFGIDTLVMVDSSVTKYFDTQIKGFKYDKYTYEIEEVPEYGYSTEIYKFYKNGELIEGYSLGWNGTELMSINDWNKYSGRK